MAEDAPQPLDALLQARPVRWEGGQFDEAVAPASAAAPKCMRSQP